ncbi:MAG: hypothetical protein FWC42_01745 [Proteobacteria bacterium]|nr:hypothetical protein [Pseudomonadota bacterium]
MITKREQIEHHTVVKSALTSQRVEGLRSDTKVIENAKKQAYDEISNRCRYRRLQSACAE